MAIKIQTEKPEIPVEIGDLKFSFDVTDESVIEFRKNGRKIQKELENLHVDEEDDETLEQVKDVLKRGYDLILGEGAFEKVYELSPSVIVCTNYLEQIVIGIEQELNKKGFTLIQKEKAQKYIQNKKKK